MNDNKVRIQNLGQSVSRGGVRFFIWGIVLVALWGMTYLGVASQTAVTGQRAHDLQETLNRIKAENSQLDYEIAVLTTPGKMAERATLLGFRPATISQTVYLVVKNYPSDTGNPASTPESQVPSTPSRSFGLAGWWNELLARLGLAPNASTTEASP